MKHVIISFIGLLLLTGCWDRNELNEISIAYGIGVDKQDDEHIVTVQVINPEQVAGRKGGGSSNLSPVLIYEEKDKTLLNAFRKMSRTAPRKIYVAHLYILVIGEDAAKDGLDDILDLLYRDQEVRTDFYVFVAKNGKAKDVLSTPTPYIAVPAREIYDSLRYSNKHYNPAKATTIRELISKTVTEGVHPVMSSLLLEESSHSIPEPPLPTGDLAVFHNDTLRGWLNDEQANIYNIITNNIYNSVNNFRCGRKIMGH